MTSLGFLAYKYFKMRNIFKKLLFLGLILFFFFQSNAQIFYLKDYVLGNSYDPNNKTWSWKASKYCPYNYSIKANRVDYFGGEIELHVSPGTQPDCKSIYLITWAFDKDIRTVSCGERIMVDFKNQPIVKENCGIFVWEGDMNPSSISIITGSGVGESSLVYEERKNDPQGSYRDYVFSHHPGHVVHGEPVANQGEFVHVHHARVALDVCSRKDFAEIANGGSFTLRMGNRGISFDVVYLYSKKQIIIDPPKQTLPNPTIQHNIQNTEGVYWMQITIPGYLQNFYGKQVQLVLRFTDANGNYLPGIKEDQRYIDASGYAATGSGMISVNSNNFYLGPYVMWMPYYALNLPNTGGATTHSLYTFAEVYSEGKLIMQSQMVPFTVSW